jgi:hypothetical protein
MGLRLILVSVVAGLGVSLPGADDFNAWSLRAQDWMNAKLAEWDAPYPNEGGAFVFDADASEPATIEPAPAPASPRAEATGADFDAVQEEIVAGFAADLTPATPAPKVILVEDSPALAETPTSGPSFDAIQEEIVSGFMADLIPAGNAPEAFAAGPEPKPSPAGTPKVEPIDEPDDLYAGIAYALNREADGLAAAPVPAAAAPQTDQWAQAIRLTREAAFAWANLLHGPAVVTIAR